MRDAWGIIGRAGGPQATEGRNVKEAWRVTLRHPGKRTRKLIVCGCEPREGDCVKLAGMPFIVTSVERADIVAEFVADGKKLKQVYP